MGEVMTDTGTTHYSAVVSGTRENFARAVCFDVTDGYLGMTQFAPESQTVVEDRVLLAPQQVTALLAFISTQRRTAGVVRFRGR